MVNPINTEQGASPLQFTIPVHAQIVNRISSIIFSRAVMRPFVSGGLGLIFGRWEHPCRAPYIFNAVLTDLFWRYFFPFTVQKIFMNEHNNKQARIIGLVVGYVSSVVIPFLVTRYVIPQYINDDTVVLGKFKKEIMGTGVGQPFSMRDAFRTSTPAAYIAIFEEIVNDPMLMPIKRG